MTIADAVIGAAVARYDRERDRYIKLAARVADICRANVVEENAIRAQVTSRTKTVRSFEGKLHRFARRTDKHFETVDDVFDKIGDFAGVRIAAYRPEDESRVTAAVVGLFEGFEGGKVDVDPKNRLDPEKARFYRATHCQVFLREEELVGDYGNLRGASCEIQICSMMAHVWNEIEHDIGYKPEGSGPGETERGLLEVLGHLTRSGDATITQLLAANAARLTAQTGDFGDVHDFIARLRKHFPDADLSVNAGPAYDEARLLGLTSEEKMERILGAEALNQERAIARITQFNVFVEESGQPELSLNRGSADLILVGMLARCLEQIEENHPIGRSKGRPPRIYSLARAYRDYRESKRETKDAA